MDEPLRVVVVDDHPMLRDGVARSLEESGKFTVVAQGGTADEAVRLAQEHKPNLLLLDLSMPGGGLAAARKLADVAADVMVVVLTASEANEDVFEALRLGAKGYVLKGVGSSALIEVLQGVARGESYVSPVLAARLLVAMKRHDASGAAEEDPLSRLTRREEEILKLVSQGLSNKEVGLKLDLQEKTVKHHMTHILAKLQVKNRTEAAVLLRDSAKR